MTQFLKVEEETGCIMGGIGRPDPDGFVGPPSPTPDPEQGFIFMPWQGALVLSGSPTPTCTYEWSDAGPAWVEYGDIDTQRAHKAAAISSSCADAILAGFVSSALGDPHTYPAKPNDQINLAGLVMRSFYPSVGPDWARPFWCMDAGNVWAYRMHTAAQIQQVGDDSIDANLIQRGINEQLQAQIIAAETPADLAGIIWPSEAP
jgi:hypothetical protein